MQNCKECKPSLFDRSYQCVWIIYTRTVWMWNLSEDECVWGQTSQCKRATILSIELKFSKKEFSIIDLQKLPHSATKESNTLSNLWTDDYRSQLRCCLCKPSSNADKTGRRTKNCLISFIIIWPAKIVSFLFILRFIFLKKPVKKNSS